MNNISLADFSGGASWTPIGEEFAPFNAIFEGNGREIHDLIIKRPNQNYVDLFGAVFGEIRNLGVKGCGWDFGTSSQYPTISCLPITLNKQRSFYRVFGDVMVHILSFPAE